MRFLLDTNTCIGHLTGRSPSISARLSLVAPDELALCSIVKAELLYGARKSAQVEANLERLAAFFEPFVCLAFDDDAAEQYGLLRADLERQGTPIGPNDLMIAAIARTHGLTLVTGNRKEFERVTALTIEHW
jgi:tRNA(fMet)-specific endonuclease VapC